MRKQVLAAVLLMASLPVLAGPMEDQLLAIQHTWAHDQYELEGEAREKAFEELSKTAEQFVAQYPGRAEPLIWQGIVLSTYAGAKGGLGALSLVKDARRAFEAALAIDETALDGSAHTSLGSLYYQVPGWPIGFGNDDEARHHLLRALTIAPLSIDANYFYADFLRDQGEPERAKVYFERALKAAPRPDRPLADIGRHRDIEKQLQAIN